MPFPLTLRADIAARITGAPRLSLPPNMAAKKGTKKTAPPTKSSKPKPDSTMGKVAADPAFASTTNVTTFTFHAPQRRIIRFGLDELARLLKDAKRTAKKVFVSTTEIDDQLGAVKSAGELIPGVIPDDHDGKFNLDDVTRLVVATALLVWGSVLLARRDGLGKMEVETNGIQHKIDEVEALRASLADQRDLFEYSGATKDDPEALLDLLDEVLTAAQMPTLDDIAEWPFTWRQEAAAWASAAKRAEEEPDANVSIPPRPTFLPTAKQLPLV